MSHLSYEEQGIDKVPTVHLGHIASAMERKGKRTEKGDLNRNIEAYNELKSIISELEKDRELLQQKFDKEIKLESFNQSLTEEERKAIHEASKYLDSKVSLALIDKRLKQLEKWSANIRSNEKFMQWKFDTIQQAKATYSSINFSRKQIEIREKALANIKWMNPLKYKDNKQQAENLEKQIESLKKDLESQYSQLEYPKSKLNFETYEQLRDIEKSFKIEFEEAEKTNRSKIRANAQELDVLENARDALKSAYIREIASKYPDVHEMAYIDFETAQNLEKFNHANGRTFKPEEIQKEYQRIGENIEKVRSYNNPQDSKELEHMLPQLKQMQGFLDSIIQGIQQAQQRQQREGERERHERTKKKKRPYGLER